MVYRPSPHSQNLCSLRAGGECLAHCRGVCRLRKHTNEQPIARGLRGGAEVCRAWGSFRRRHQTWASGVLGWCSASEPSARVHPGQPCHSALQLRAHRDPQLQGGVVITRTPPFPGEALSLLLGWLLLGLRGGFEPKGWPCPPACLNPGPPASQWPAAQAPVKRPHSRVGDL